MDRYETLVSSRNEGHFRARVLPLFQFARSGGDRMYYTLHHSGRISRYSLGSASPPRTELSRLGFVLLCFGQANHKTGAPIVTIFARKCPAVRFDDAAGNREPHSGAFRFG